MSEPSANATFEGWAVIELMGHQRETGFVKTEYFGTTALLRVDVPELPEREWVLTSPEWSSNGMIPVGATVKRAAVQGRTRYVSPGALYAMNPCSEDAARKAIDASIHRAILVVSLPEGKQLGPTPIREERQEEMDLDIDYQERT
jgi:hypothetical protein